ncbi:hypothetical protein C2E21_1756 [Chlorella sorokiniana]|uniref:Uncharacterized protein n=1 Tax=Chlorella sorokiniana TaxID=3076 RepID=A0A2P6U192_CHLSO|nr:hypothetical protein C2E21_1756 [Chlorella sorokiniana]|eukprot:PRW60080.1 hypothetical protein C2E21_1756 [Chlorella sorokiniana]
MAAPRETKLAKDQALAGLSFAFEPVSVAPAARSSPRKAPRAPPAAVAAAAAAPKVSFSLRERGPGPTYGSPPPAAEQQQQDASRPGSAAQGAAGLAALKLASLRRRAAVLAAAPPAAEPGDAAEDRPTLPNQPAAEEEAGRQQREEEDELLRCIETRLAGCSAGVLQEPAAAVLPPQHVLLGLPALAPGPPAVAPSAGSQTGGQPEELIGAYRPADCGAAAAQPSVEAPQAGGQLDGCAAATATGSAGSSAGAAAGPQTLEEALQCLGLLGAQPAEGRQGGEALPTSSSSSSEGAAGQPRWLRLRAVQVVVAAKQWAAAAADLLPLVQRLRQVRMHLEFHKVAWPTAETSELQVQLLGSLQQKLLLKLALAVLRQAVATARLLRHLLDHAELLAAADLRRSVLGGWYAAAVPTPQQEAAAAALARQLSERHQRTQLAVWRQWAAHRAWQLRQVAQGQHRLRRRLLLAAMQHWRCYCQQRLVERLQGALAARWAVAWGQRRLFAAWRQAARRSAALKAALTRSSSGRQEQAWQPPPSQLEALAATAAAFQAVKEFVAEAAEQLAFMQQGLRSWMPASSSAEAQQAEEGSQRQQESAELQEECTQLEQAAVAAQQAAGEQQQSSVAAAAAKQAAAAAMQAAVQLHTAVAAECSQQERHLRQRQHESQEAAAAEAGARAAAHAAAEQLSLAEMGVQRWSKAVEGIAKELAACHRTQQAPIMARLKEARQRLEQHQHEAAAVHQQLPELRAAVKRGGQQAQQAQQAVLDAQQLLVAAAERKARAKQQLDAAVAQHEAAAVAAVSSEHEASSAEQRQRFLEAQQQAVAGRLRQAAQQVLHKQQAAALLQQQVAALQLAAEHPSVRGAGTRPASAAAHSWRAWARQRRMKAARQRAALAVYERRLLAAGLRQWRWVQRSKSLLRRVFGTAVELWQEEVGVRLHQRSFELLQACWGAWQLYLLQAQAHRRAAMLWNAAEAFR